MMTKKARTPRLYLPPRDTGLNTRMTLDEMELFAHTPTPLGDWATRILSIEQEKVLDEIGADRYLPRGVVHPSMEDGVMVASLLDSSGQVFRGDGWGAPEVDLDYGASIDMDHASVAFVARALIEGADAVIFREARPVGVLGAGEGGTAEELPSVPDDAAVIAIVDGMDREAVLELLAVTPGPEVYRRSDGRWLEDPGWVNVLRSVQPPPMVAIDSDALLAMIVKQVDTATTGEVFTPFKDSDRSKYIMASSYLRGLAAETDEALVSLNVALLAVAGKEVSPSDIARTERLRRYWLYGEGAAKIRWGTPGSWRRCYKHLVKYLGPHMAPGYCTNLSQRLGGHGVATHVTQKVGD